jgi:putative heme-binding domain-containing protein
MSRRYLLLAPLIGLVVLTFVFAQPKAKPAPQWVWFDEGNPLSDAPAAARYFRRTLTIDKPVASASLEVAADNEFVVWVNGKQVGSGNDWAVLSRFDVKANLVGGKNLIAIQAINHGGPAGLVVRLTYTPQGGTKQTLVSDGAWLVSKAADPGWSSAGFDDAKWAKVKVLGEYGKVGPWVGGGSGSSASPTFAVKAGFEVVPAVKNPGDRGAFSLVNMTFDARGRLLVSLEGQGILLCTKPDKDGVMQQVADYCTLVKNCQGMCWVDDALLLVGNGPKGTGLYRCRDTKGSDKIDEVTLLHRFDGGMGEHGPHAVVHGPDDHLYVVVGNHAHAGIGPKKAPNPEKIAPNSPLLRWPTGGQSPDQGKPGSCEDVLLPRLNDANGHAANLRAPGGTIWRMDKQGKNMALVAAGFRNQFDAAFSPSGELFSFDSDMEWDEGLPWYRPVRAVHCIPGAEFGWRTGASKIPPYALDTLPPLADTGRGSPVGVAFYDHSRFGPEYRGAYLMADWSLGIIYAVHLKRKGATYEPKVEKFVTGKPMNVTDLEVAPDGSVVFTTGGRGSAGGVFRIVRKAAEAADSDLEQPLAAWSRAARKKQLAMRDKETAWKNYFFGAGLEAPPWDVRYFMLATIDGIPVPTETLREVAKREGEGEAEARAWAVWMLSLREGNSAALLGALRDRDALVRRRACEGLIRAGVTPKVDAIWPLLADSDRFVRTAARLVLQRIDSKEWAGRISKEPKDGIAREAIVALCKIDKAAEHASVVFARLNTSTPKTNAEMLDHLRTIQLACFHTAKLPAAAKDVAVECDNLFPHAHALVNRELAIVLTHFRRTKVIETEVVGKLLDALEASKGDRQQQIHYFYCLRLLAEGWTPEQHARLSAWYDSTQNWNGGASYRGFLANIFRECLASYTLADRKDLLSQGDKTPHAASVLVQRLGADRQTDLLPAMRDLLPRAEKSPRAAELVRSLRETILLCASEKPTKEAFPDLVWGLSSSNKVILFEAISALSKIDARPKPDDAKTYRALLTAAGKLDAGNRWKAVELLRHWSNDRRFGADEGQWQPELASWSRWFAQAFPKEPALPAAEGDRPTASKYAFDDLLAFVTKGDGKTGDIAKGRKAFEKSQCIKCHKFGKEGEGLGPDLTTLSKRFKRFDILESIYFPSKVISDQYRSTTIVTKRGQRIDGLAAVQGDNVTVLQADGSKTTLRKKDIDQQFSSLVSVMPEKLLDLLTKQEIADLFAFLESEPAK